MLSALSITARGRHDFFAAHALQHKYSTVLLRDFDKVKLLLVGTTPVYRNQKSNSNSTHSSTTKMCGGGGFRVCVRFMFVRLSPSWLCMKTG